MRRAAELVRQHNLPIKEIAHRCGCSDISNFYRDFRMVHDITPQGLRMEKLEFRSKSKDSLPSWPLSE
jgi:AraC-like DNA-binding protein